MNESSTRRDFLRQSTDAALAAATLGTLVGVHAEAAPPPETVNVGIIGCGGIMTSHVRGLAARGKEVSIAWLCDVDPAQIDRMAGVMGDSQPSPAKRTLRYEDVIEDRSVDAVIIATPHHWHAPIALAAIHSGKDVYIEKPISHVFDEGPKIIAAARQYNRVIQHGSQMRSSPVTEKAAKLLAEGLIGEIKVARAWTAEIRETLKPVPDSLPPQGVEYDRWLGPAPVRPFNRHRFHQTWRLFADYGNGEIGDDGIHDLDMARWGLGVDTLPSRVTARGSRMLLHGHDGDYPDNMTVTYEYPDGRLLIYENYPFTAYGLHGFDNGNVFYGTEGYMIFSRRGAFSTFLGPKSQPGPTEGRELRGQRGYAEHMTNFLNAVRTRDMRTNCPAEAAHLSCALVHFGEIAYRMGRQLEFDAEQGRFIDCDAANALLTKQYREPFVLPDVV